MLGLRFCARAFSSCGERGPLFITVCGPLAIAASLVAEHRLQTCRLSSCGSRTQLLHGMWDLPRPGLKTVSPASAGRFSTTAPPGKPPKNNFFNVIKKERREQPNQKTNPPMITSAKNYTKKKQQQKKTDRQNPRTNGKSKAIQTKSHREAYTYTLTKREIGTKICISLLPKSTSSIWDDSLFIQVFHRCRVH